MYLGDKEHVNISSYAYNKMIVRNKIWFKETIEVLILFLAMGLISSKVVLRYLFPAISTIIEGTVLTNIITGFNILMVVLIIGAGLRAIDLKREINRLFEESILIDLNGKGEVL